MISALLLLAIFLIALVLGIIITPRIANLAHGLHLYDLPNARKVHTLPIPRLGGVAFLPIVIVTIATILVVLLRFDSRSQLMWKGESIQHLLSYLAGVMMLYALGLYDDILGVGYKMKFVVQIIASALLCVSGLWIATLGHVFLIDELTWWIGMPFTILVVVYLTNAINLIDGIDGLASGLSCIALAALAFLDVICGNMVWAMLAMAYLGVVMSFFYYNVFDNKHKIFMGDGGSLTLGFTLAFLILPFWHRDPIWNPNLHNIGIVAVSTMVIPMFDVVRVMMSRLRDKRNPFLPDKNHIHHKFLRAGLSAKMSMAAILLLSCVFIISNYLVATYLSQTLIIVFDILLFCGVHLLLNVFIAKKEKETGIKSDRIFKTMKGNIICCLIMPCLLLYSCSEDPYYNHRVLWVGTSIPEGCPYPQNACRALGWKCYNVALGASGIIKHSGFLDNDRDGRDLCETSEEKEERYRPFVLNGTIEKEDLERYKTYGFEERVLPYLNGSLGSCDIIVIDHGFNDRNVIAENDQYAVDDYVFDSSKPDSCFNRATFLGAMDFLLKKIYENAPKAQVIVCSYLENFSDSLPNGYQGKVVCNVLKKISTKLNIPYLNICDYNDFNYEYVTGTENYISDYNDKYGTDYVVYNWGGPNPNGLVTTFQYYCPDGIHPHTDKSSRAEAILSANLENALKKLSITTITANTP